MYLSRLMFLHKPAHHTSFQIGIGLFSTALITNLYSHLKISMFIDDLSPSLLALHCKISLGCIFTTRRKGIFIDQSSLRSIMLKIIWNTNILCSLTEMFYFLKMDICIENPGFIN